jgi:hypothetical protein
MDRNVTLARIEHESSISAARVAVALSLGLAFWCGGPLFLRAMVGSLGMYAVTDGVFAALTGGPRLARAARIEGALSVCFGLLILLQGGGEGALLVLFSLRGLGVALVGLVLGLAGDPRELRHSLSPTTAGALRRYALLWLAGTSAAFLLLAVRGHGALELSGWLAGQLVLWAALLVLHARRTGEAVAAPYGVAR